MTNQHISDAIASLEARLIAKDPEWQPAVARQLATDFIQALIEHGWRPYAIERAPQRHHEAADPERVKALLADFRAQRPQGEQA